jgi:hypothetical protein
MASLCDFLRVRGVPEETISLMEDQKVSETVICVVLVPGVAHVFANMVGRVNEYIAPKMLTFRPTLCTVQCAFLMGPWCIR